MTNDQEVNIAEWRSRTPATGGKNDLHERTAAFGEAIIRYAKRISFNPITTCLID